MNATIEIPTMKELSETKFKAVLKDGVKIKRFKALIEGASGLLSEFNLMVNKSGLWLRQFDSSRAALLYFELNETLFFDEYVFESEHEEVMFCLDAAIINRLFKKANTKCSEVSFEFMPLGQHPTLRVKIHSDITLNEKVILLTPPDSNINRPALESMGICHVMASEFSGYIKEACKANMSHLKFSLRDRTETKTTEHGEEIIYPKGLVMESESDESSVFYELEDENSVWDLWVNQGKTQTAMFATNYLKEITKLFAKDDELKLKITTQKPLIVEMESTDGRSITYIQAPRIERR